MAAAEEGEPVYDANGFPVNVETVVEAYLQRCFPMSEDRDAPLAWYRPVERAVITWDSWRIPRSLQKTWKQKPYIMTHDQDFAAVIRSCADREQTWIGRDIEELYCQLHHRAIAHSVEVWDQDGALVGGLYGLTLGAVFCGESMFHRAANASKLAVVYLVRHLQQQGFQLLDCQQQTPHMDRFGARVIDDRSYQQLFEAAIEETAQF